jgi:hypothetical protein
VEIHSAAARGVSTPATPLPYLDRIQASFGRHPIGHIKAHMGSEASRASRDMNALAFASGGHVVFSGTPDIRTAAHEAAHVVQQQAGVHLAGGVGREGDSYERHANAVADAVVAGRSAEGLLTHLSSVLIKEVSLRSPLDSYVAETSIVQNEAVESKVDRMDYGTSVQAKLDLSAKWSDSPRIVQMMGGKSEYFRVWQHVGWPNTEFIEKIRQWIPNWAYASLDQNDYTGRDSVLIQILTNDRPSIENVRGWLDNAFDNDRANYTLERGRR